MDRQATYLLGSATVVRVGKGSILQGNARVFIGGDKREEEGTEVERDDFLDLKHGGLLELLLSLGSRLLEPLVSDKVDINLAGFVDGTLLCLSGLSLGELPEGMLWGSLLLGSLIRHDVVWCLVVPGWVGIGAKGREEVVDELGGKEEALGRRGCENK